MPGLCGIAGENIQESWPRLLRSLHRDNLHVTDFKGESLCFGMTSLGIFFASKQPLWDEAGNYAIIADGYMVVDDDISDSADKSRETLSLLLRSFMENGYESLVKKIRTGVFNILIYDARLGNIVLINDRLGMNPLYYYEGKDFVFSYNVESILQVEDIKKEADSTGLAELLTIGYPLGNRTLIERIKRLPAASVLTCNISSRAVQIRKYYADKPTRRSSRKASVRDCVEEASATFEQACRRLYLPAKQYCLMLSGGCDSRLIAGAWPSSENMFSYSWGEKGSLEVKIAKRVAEIQGIGHHSLELSGDVVAKALHETFREVGNLRYPNRLISAKEMKDLGAEISVDGLLGGNILGGLGIDTKGDSLGQIVDSLFGIIATAGKFCKNYLTDDTIAKIEGFQEEIKKDIENEIMSFQNLRTANEVQGGVNAEDELLRESAYRFRIYLDRQGVSLQGVGTRSEVEIVYPFIDYDFYDFCMQVPAGLVIGHQLYMNIFKQKYSRYSFIPYSKSLLPLKLPPKLHELSERINHIVFDRIMRNVQRLLKRELIPIWWTWDNWDKWIRHDVFREAFWDIVSDSKVIDRKKTKKLIEAHGKYELSIPYGLPMLSLLGFALWTKELGWETAKSNIEVNA
ncbi:MAG: hypothetical protein GTO51_06725 [Candidatus Latescibacteria bacterium]|nr:hypothetical protein [Candidatus Latescibacterota bacterium]NIM21497.1 hypothetical protein [Candidatus Latescibacterota bacterium]NIM65668.1 hypothetical protein [Candidatus Latescibacterota bacterium]NIO02050.1 hypothetical protein [Candidatus Latescibacterota bacterium]NIO28862.1 hypothetical protein [Candidatus Latescibacterota bacterium]